jgi:hypothetical protein
MAVEKVTRTKMPSRAGTLKIAQVEPEIHATPAPIFVYNLKEQQKLGEKKRERIAKANAAANFTETNAFKEGLPRTKTYKIN